MQVEITILQTYMKRHKLGPTDMGKALSPAKPRQRINSITEDGKEWYVVEVKNKLKLMRFQ